MACPFFPNKGLQERGVPKATSYLTSASKDTSVTVSRGQKASPVGVATVELSFRAKDLFCQQVLLEEGKMVIPHFL